MPPSPCRHDPEHRSARRLASAAPYFEAQGEVSNARIARCPAQHRGGTAAAPKGARCGPLRSGAHSRPLSTGARCGNRCGGGHNSPVVPLFMTQKAHPAEKPTLQFGSRSKKPQLRGRGCLWGISCCARTGCKQGAQCPHCAPCEERKAPMRLRSMHISGLQDLTCA